MTVSATAVSFVDNNKLRNHGFVEYLFYLVGTISLCTNLGLFVLGKNTFETELIMKRGCPTNRQIIYSNEIYT